MPTVIFKLLATLLASPYLLLLLFLLVCAALYIVYCLVHQPELIKYGQPIAADHSRKQPGKTLYSERYALAGKPDFLIEEKDGQIIPVEYKSRKLPRGGAYKSHILQLASYCALVEEHYGRKPDYGIIQYSIGSSIKVAYSEKLKREMLELNEMLKKIKRGEWTPLPLPTEWRWFCKYCAHRDKCAGGAELKMESRRVTIEE